MNMPKSRDILAIMPTIMMRQAVSLILSSVLIEDGAWICLMEGVEAKAVNSAGFIAAIRERLEKRLA